MLTCVNTGPVSKLPVASVTPEDVEAFCSAHKVKFHALGTQEDANDPEHFQVVTILGHDMAVPVPYENVRSWKAARDQIGERRVSGGRYRHYKGGVYETIGPATIEATMEDAVLYKGVDGKVWVRPVNDFFDVALVGGGNFVPRFVYLGPVEAAAQA